MRILIAVGIAAGLVLSLPAGASESTLARIKQSGTIKLGYRENSIPFSFVGDDKQPRGYSVDLCRIVADDLAAQLRHRAIGIDRVAKPGPAATRQRLRGAAHFRDPPEVAAGVGAIGAPQDDQPVAEDDGIAHIGLPTADVEDRSGRLGRQVASPERALAV
mgnify:CR=1 FL=1